MSLHIALVYMPLHVVGQTASVVICQLKQEPLCLDWSASQYQEGTFQGPEGLKR